MSIAKAVIIALFAEALSITMTCLYCLGITPDSNSLILSIVFLVLYYASFFAAPILMLCASEEVPMVPLISASISIAILYIVVMIVLIFFDISHITEIIEKVLVYGSIAVTSLLFLGKIIVRIYNYIACK